MKDKMKRSLMVLAVTALLFGCSEKEASKPAKPSVPKGTLTYEKMATNDVIVIVNGQALTKGAAELQIAVQQEAAKLANKNIRLTDLERQRTKALRGMEKLFIERRVMLDEAARRGITLTAEDRKAIRDRFAKSVLKGRALYGLVVGKLDAEKRAELDRGLDFDMLVQKVSAELAKECAVKVTPAEAEKKYKDIEAYNVGAVAEETQIWKNATNVWERIQRGESFEQAALRSTTGNEHANSDMEWGDFDLDFFKGDRELCHYLSVMPEGTVTPPVPGDNGVLLVKLLKKIPADFSADQVKPRYRLAKIFFELPETYTLGTVEELRQEMEHALSEKAFKERVAALVAAAKIEYPNGKIELVPNRRANGLQLKDNKKKDTNKTEGEKR